MVTQHTAEYFLCAAHIGTRGALTLFTDKLRDSDWSLMYSALVNRFEYKASSVMATVEDEASGETSYYCNGALTKSLAEYFAAHDYAAELVDSETSQLALFRLLGTDESLLLKSGDSGVMFLANATQNTHDWLSEFALRLERDNSNLYTMAQLVGLADAGDGANDA